MSQEKDETMRRGKYQQSVDVDTRIRYVEKRWLSKDEAKSYLGCSDDFLARLRNEALVSFSQFGKMIWYDLKSIDRFLDANKVI